jgi:hypothetical protein
MRDGGIPGRLGEVYLPVEVPRAAGRFLRDKDFELPVESDGVIRRVFQPGAYCDMNRNDRGHDIQG